MAKSANKTQERVMLVLDRIKEIVAADEDEAQLWSEELERLLTDIHQQDGFGTEGQNDPRGDFRDGEWSMDDVQGYDRD
jgi:hypothetical protein